MRHLCRLFSRLNVLYATHVMKVIVSHSDPVTMATQRQFLQQQLQNRVVAAAGNTTLLRQLAQEADELGCTIPGLSDYSSERIDRTLSQLKRALEQSH